MSRKCSMRTIRRKSGWWVIDIPESPDGCGPYDLKKDAAEDMRGMEVFFRNENNREFFTTSKETRSETSTLQQILKEGEPDDE